MPCKRVTNETCANGNVEEKANCSLQHVHVGGIELGSTGFNPRAPQAVWPPSHFRSSDYLKPHRFANRPQQQLDPVDADEHWLTVFPLSYLPYLARRDNKAAGSGFVVPSCQIWQV
eukprot:gene48-biopygen1036